MTIETGSAQNTSRPAATESKHAKGKTGDAHSHGSGGAGGFMAILASLDTSDVAAPAAGLLGDDTLSGKGLPAGGLGALARGAAALKGVRQSGDVAGDVDPAAPQDELGKLLQAGTGDAAAALPATADVAVPPEVPLDTSALLAQAAQWSVVPATNTEQGTPTTAASVTTNLSGATKLPQTKLDGAATAVGAVASDTVSELGGKASKAQKDVFARLASAQAALTVPADAGNTATDTRQAQLMQKVAESPLAPVAAALAAANTVGPARREDSARERSVFRSNAVDSTSPASQSTYAPSVSGVSAPTAPEPVTSTDTFVAEKVAYWISNDVQNAEMKLDGIGDKPVEVSIRMQGNEAHIAFRSDELQARAALENASIHLKDMLQREGLVLSGVSVGTSGAGDSGDQGGKPRQGARQSGVASVQPARMDRAPGLGRVSGGALDLFV